LDWETAEAWQEAYGFSRFRLGYQDLTWSVERLGQHYFRVRQPLPATLESVLSEIEPSRCLLLASSQPLPGAAFREVSASFHMVGQSTGTHSG
jgi:hypothetical protein